MVNFLLAVLITLTFAFLLFLAIVALCVVIVIRDDRRERKDEKTQTQKQAGELPPQDKKKIKQFQNLMNYDGTKQRVIEDED
nr:MAG TPA: Protocadherin-15, LHFPL tetraspan subfamily member, LHFPL5, protocadherin, tip link [Caudoviricetes sp.]